MTYIFERLNGYVTYVGATGKDSEDLSNDSNPQTCKRRMLYLDLGAAEDLLVGKKRTDKHGGAQGNCWKR